MTRTKIWFFSPSSMTDARRAVIAGLLVFYAAFTVAQVPVWRSESAVWAHAALVAPLKPRPVLNAGNAALLTGDVDRAERTFLLVIQLASLPHVPPYDRDDALRAATANLQTLAIVRFALK